ncbi:uncharacterized protein LOC135501306 [Lineus longissimus]|uniref:uncharacterized protein LOC135501306 n=1 Tax=Lineus longissimus TaxID=88925 RepID=UPI00315CC939
MDNRQWQMGQGSQPNYVQNLQLGQLQRRSNDGNPSWPTNQQVQWPEGAQAVQNVNQQFPQANLANTNSQIRWQLRQRYLNRHSVASRNQSGQVTSGEQMHNQNWRRESPLQLNSGSVINQVNYGQGMHQVCTTTNYSRASNQQFHQASVSLPEWQGYLSSQRNERSCLPPADHLRNAVNINQAQFLRQLGNKPSTSGVTVNCSASSHLVTSQLNILHHENRPVGNETEQLNTRRLSDGYQLPNPTTGELAQLSSDSNILSHLHRRYEHELLQRVNDPVLASVLSDQTQIGLHRAMPSPGIAPVLSPGSAPMLSPGSAPMLGQGTGSVPYTSAAPMPRPPSASSSYHSHSGTAPMQRPPSTASSYHSQNQGQDVGLCLRLSQASSHGRQHCSQRQPSEVRKGQSAVSNGSRSSTPHAACDSLTDNQACEQQSSIFTSFLSGIREDIQNLKGLTLETLKNSKQILKDKMHSLHIHLQDEQEGSGIISHNKITLYNSAVQEMEALMLTLQNEIAERQDEEAMKMLEMILAGDNHTESTSAQNGMETNQMVETLTRRKSQDHAASIRSSSSQHVVRPPSPELLQPAVQDVQTECVQRSERSMSDQRVSSRVVGRRSSGESRPADARPMRPESRESGNSDGRREVRPQSRQSGYISVSSYISSDVQVISVPSLPRRRGQDSDYDPVYERELIQEAVEYYTLSPLEEISSSSETEDDTDNPPEYVVMDEDDIRNWYEFAMRPTSPDIMEEQQPHLVISNVQSLSHWVEGDTNSAGVEQHRFSDNAARMEAMLSRINHVQDYLANVVDITPPSTPDESTLRSESHTQKSPNVDVSGGVLPGQEGISLRRLFSLVVDHDYSDDSGTDTLQHDITIRKEISDNAGSVMNKSALLKSVGKHDLREETVQAMTMSVSKEDQNKVASTTSSGQESDSVQTTVEASRLPEYGKMFEAIESDSEDEDSESADCKDIPEYDESSEESLPEITHQPWRKHKVVRRRCRLGSSPSVLSTRVTMSDEDRKMITSVWNNDRTDSQRKKTLTTDFMASRTADKSDIDGKSQMAQDSVLDATVTEKDNTQYDKTSSKAANETFPAEQPQTSGSEDNVISDLELAEVTGLNSTSDREAYEIELPGLNEKPESSEVRARTVSDGCAPQSVVDSDVKLQENQGENVACVLTERGIEMQETYPLVSDESSKAIINKSDSTHDIKSAEHCTNPLMTDTDLVIASMCEESVEPVLETDACVLCGENDVDTLGMVGKSVSNDSLPSTDSLASTEKASQLDTSGEMNSTVEEISTPNNVQLDIGNSVSSTLRQGQSDVDKDIISKGHEHENEPNDECESSASESRQEVLPVSSTSQNTSSETSNKVILDRACSLPEPKIESDPCTAGPEDDFDQSEPRNKSDKGIQDQGTAAQSASGTGLSHIDVNPCTAGPEDDFDQSEPRNKSDEGIQDQGTAAQSASGTGLSHIDVNRDDAQPGEPQMFEPEPSISEQTSEMRLTGIDSSMKTEIVAANSTQPESEHEKLPDIVPSREGTDGETDNVSPLGGPEQVDEMSDENKTLGILSNVVEPQTVGETVADKLLTQIVKGDNDSLFLDFEPKDETKETSHAQPEYEERLVGSESSIGGQGDGAHEAVKRNVSESDGEKTPPRSFEDNDDSASVGGFAVPSEQECVLSDEASSSDYNESDGECDSELVFAIAEYFKNSSYDESSNSSNTSIETKSEGIELGEEEELMGDLGPEEEFCFTREISRVSTDSHLSGDWGPEELCSRRLSVVSTDDSKPANTTSSERESSDHVNEESSEKGKRSPREDVTAENGARSDAGTAVSTHVSHDSSAQVSEDKSSCSKENVLSEKSGLGDKSAKIQADAEPKSLVKEKVSQSSSIHEDTESATLKEKASPQSKLIGKTKLAGTEPESLVKGNISSQPKAKSKQADARSDELVEENTFLQSISETHQTDTKAERDVKEKDSSQSKPKTSDKVEKDSGSQSQKPPRENAMSCLEEIIWKTETDATWDGTGHKTQESGSDMDIDGESNGDFHFEVKTLDELQVEEPVYARSLFGSPRISRRGRGSDLPWRGRGNPRGRHRRNRSRSPPSGYFNDDMDIGQNVSEQREDSDLCRESYRRSEQEFRGDNCRGSRRWHMDDQHHEYRRSHRDADDCRDVGDVPHLSPGRLGNALRLVTALSHDRPPLLPTPDGYRNQHRSREERLNRFHPRGQPEGMRLPPPSDQSWLPEGRFDRRLPGFLHEDQRKQPLLTHERLPWGQYHSQDDRLYHPRELIARNPFEHIDRSRQRLSFRDPSDRKEIPRKHPRNEDYHGPVLDTPSHLDCEDQRPGPNQGLPYSESSQERPPRLDLPFVEKPQPLPLDEERPQPLVDLPFYSAHKRSPRGRVSMWNNLHPQPEGRLRNESMAKSPTKGNVGWERNFPTGSVTSMVDREQKENIQSNEKEDNRQIVSNPSRLEPWHRTLSKQTSLDLSQNKLPDIAIHEPVSKQPGSASPGQWDNKKQHPKVTDSATINEADSVIQVHVASRSDDAKPQQFVESKKPHSDTQKLFENRLSGSATQQFVESELPDSATTTSEKREHSSVTLKPDQNKKLDSVTQVHIESGQDREVPQEQVDRRDTLPGKQPNTVTGKDHDSENKDSRKFNQVPHGSTNATCLGGEVPGSINEPSVQTTSEKPHGVAHKTLPVKTRSQPLLSSREEMQNWLNMGLKDEHPRKKSTSRSLSQSSKVEKTVKEGQQISTSKVVAKSPEGQSKPVAEPERCKGKGDFESVAKKLLATKPIGTFCGVTEKDLVKGVVTPPKSGMTQGDGVQITEAYLSDYMKNLGKSKPKASTSLQGQSFRKKPSEKSGPKSSDVQEKLSSEKKGVKHRHEHRHGTDVKDMEKKSGDGGTIGIKGKVLEGDEDRKQETRAKGMRKESSVGEVKARKGEEPDASKGQNEQCSSAETDQSPRHTSEARGKKNIKKISLDWYKKKKTLEAGALSDFEESQGKLQQKTLDARAFSLENDAQLREKIAASEARINALVNRRRRVEIIPHVSLGRRIEEARRDSTAVGDSDVVQQKTLKDEKVSHFAELSVCNRGDNNPKSVVTKMGSGQKNLTSASEVKGLSSKNSVVTSPDPESELKQKVDQKEKKPGSSDADDCCQMQEPKVVKKGRISTLSSADKSVTSSSSLNQESDVAQKELASVVGMIDLTGSDSESVKETKQGSDKVCLEGSALRSNTGQASRQTKEGDTSESFRTEKWELVRPHPVQESKRGINSKSSSADKEVTCSSPSQELDKVNKGKSSRSSSVARSDFNSSGPNQESKKAKKGNTSSLSSVVGVDLTSSILVRVTTKAKKGKRSRSSSADKKDMRGSKSKSKKHKKEKSKRLPEAYKRKKRRKKSLSYLSSCSDISSASLEKSPSLSRSRSRSRERRSRNRYRSSFSPGRFVKRRWSPNRRSRSPSHGRHPHGRTRSRSRSPSLRRRTTRGRRSLTPLRQIHRSRSPPSRRLSPFRRSPLSPHRRSPSPQRLPYRHPVDRSTINSHDWLFGRRSPSPRQRKVHSRSPSPYRRKRRRSFSPHRRPRSRDRSSRRPRSRERSTSPTSWSRERSDTPTTIGSKSPQSDGDGSPIHIDLTSYRRAEMALCPDKPWRPPGTHPRDRHPDNVDPAPPQRYVSPGYQHGEPLHQQWCTPPPGYGPKVPLPFHPAAPTYYVPGAGFQHPYSRLPIVSMPSHSGSPMDPMQPPSHYQRNEIDMQPGPDQDVAHFNQQPGTPLYNEGPHSHQQLDFSIPPSESQVVHPGPEDVKGKPELISQLEKKPRIRKNCDPRLCDDLQKVTMVETAAEYVQKQFEERISNDNVVKENLNQPVTLKKPNIPGTSKESNKPEILDKPGPLEKSNKSGTSEKLIVRGTPEKKNSPVKAKSDQIPGIMSPNDNNLEINPRLSFMEGGASQESVDSVSISIDDASSSWDKLPLHDCIDEEGRLTETYGYSDEKYRNAFHEIEFGWPIQSTLRWKYLAKHIWDNPNAYKDNQESDVPSEETKPGKRQKKTARKSFMTASLGHSQVDPKNEIFQEARNEELAKLKTVRSEVLGSLLHEKNMEEKVKLKGLLGNIKKDIEELEDKGKMSVMGKHVTTVGNASATRADKSAVALAQRLATDLESTEMKKAETSSSTSIACTSQATSAVGLGDAVKATALLSDNTPRTSDNPEIGRTGSYASHATSAVRSTSTVPYGNIPRTSEDPQTKRSSSSSIKSVKAILLDSSPETINSLNIGATSYPRPGTSTKPELSRLSSQSSLSVTSNKNTAFRPDKPEAKKPANGANSALKPGTYQKPDTSWSETKPMITKSFFSGLDQL